MNIFLSLRSVSRRIGKNNMFIVYEDIYHGNLVIKCIICIFEVHFRVLVRIIDLNKCE